MANNIKGITITIGGNTVNLQKALKDVNKSTMSLQSELTQINRQLRFDPSSAELLSQKQKVLTESVEASKRKLRELENVQQDIERQYKNGEIDDGQYRAFQREVVQTKSKIKDYEGQLKHVNTTQKDFDKKVEQSRQTLAKSKQEFKDGAKKAAKWSAAVAAAAGGAAFAVVKSAADFESAFAKTSTLLSDKIDLKKYKEEIINLSNELGVSANETAESVYQALSASVAEDKAIPFVKSAYQLTKGGFTELTTSVDVLTTAMNAYGISADKAESISNILITTQNLGKTTVDQLAQKIGRVIPTAAAYGVQLRDIGTAYSLLTKRGVNTANATTQIRSLLVALTKEGKKTIQAGDILRQETGKSFKELSESGMSLADVLNILMQSVDGNVDKFGNLFGNVNAKAGALALLEGGTEEYNTTLKKMTESEGAAEKAYQKMADTAEHRVEVIKTNIQNSLIKIGDKLLPKAKEFLDEFEKRLPEIENIAEDLGDYTLDTVTWLSKNGDTLFRIIKATGIELGGIFVAVKAYQATKWITTTVGAFRTLQTATEGATAAQLALNTAEKANVIGAVVSGVIMLGTTLWSLYEATKAEETAIYDLSDAEVNLNEKIQDSIDRQNELKDSRKKAISEINGEYSHYKTLLSELDNIVDKNGNVKKGYEERAKYITGTLSKATDIEIKNNGKVIDSYKKIRKQIKKALDEKKLAAKQSAFSADYEEAYKNKTEHFTDYSTKNSQYTNWLNQYNALKNTEKELKSTIKNALKNDDYQTAQRAKSDLIEIEPKLKALKKNVEEAKAASDTAYRVYVNDVSIINNYEKLSEAILSGRKGKIKNALLNIENDFVTAKNGNQQILEEQVVNIRETFQQMKLAYSEGGSGITDVDVTNHQKLLYKAQVELGKYEKAHKSSGKKAGEKQVGGYVNEVNSKDSKNKVSEASQGLLSAAGGKSVKSKAKSKGKSVGKDYVNGVVEEIQKRFKKAFGSDSGINLNFENVPSSTPKSSTKKKSSATKSGIRVEVPVNATNASATVSSAVESFTKTQTSAQKSHQIINNTPTISVKFGDVSVRSEDDINAIADKVTNKVNENLGAILIRERKSFGQ